MKKIMFVAGEASGDQHAAEVYKKIKQQRPEIEAFGMGGAMLEAAGVRIEVDLVSHAVIGIVEALAKISEFFKILTLAKRLLEKERPDAVVLTDFPDLNFRIAAYAKSLGIPVIYFVSPQIWAWRKGRIHTIKKIVDHMIVVFSFEEPFYRKAGIPVTFVGHPLLEQVKPEVPVAQRRQALLGEARGPLVALLPGSRRQEIEFLLPTMAGIAKRLREKHPQIQFVVPVARTVSAERIAAILDKVGLAAQLIREQPYSARAAADLAIVSSGTATLETAILGTPMIVGYRMKRISYWLARIFVKLKFFGLANLVADEKIAPEFLQDAFSPEKVFPIAEALLQDQAMIEKQKQGWARVRNRLGGIGAAARTAEVILKIIG